jgi:hypothetical protein
MPRSRILEVRGISLSPCSSWRSQFPLTPALSPEERVEQPAATNTGDWAIPTTNGGAPSPWGEGRGEGEQGSRRFHGFRSSEPGAGEALISENRIPKSEVAVAGSRPQHVRSGPLWTPGIWLRASDFGLPSGLRISDFGFQLVSAGLQPRAYGHRLPAIKLGT